MATSSSPSIAGSARAHEQRDHQNDQEDPDRVRTGTRGHLPHGTTDGQRRRPIPPSEAARVRQIPSEEGMQEGATTMFDVNRNLTEQFHSYLHFVIDDGESDLGDFLASSQYGRLHCFNQQQLDLWKHLGFDNVNATVRYEPGAKYGILCNEHGDDVVVRIVGVHDINLPHILVPDGHRARYLTWHTNLTRSN